MGRICLGNKINILKVEWTNKKWLQGVSRLLRLTIYHLHKSGATLSVPEKLFNSFCKDFNIILFK